MTLQLPQTETRQPEEETVTPPKPQREFDCHEFDDMHMTAFGEGANAKVYNIKAAFDKPLVIKAFSDHKKCLFAFNEFEIQKEMVKLFKNIKELSISEPVQFCKYKEDHQYQIADEQYACFYIMTKLSGLPIPSLPQLMQQELHHYHFDKEELQVHPAFNIEEGHDMHVGFRDESWDPWQGHGALRGYFAKIQDAVITDFAQKSGISVDTLNQIIGYVYGSIYYNIHRRPLDIEFTLGLYDNEYKINVMDFDLCNKIDYDAEEKEGSFRSLDISERIGQYADRNNDFFQLGKLNAKKQVNMLDITNRAQQPEPQQPEPQQPQAKYLKTLRRTFSTIKGRIGAPADLMGIIKEGISLPAGLTVPFGRNQRQTRVTVDRKPQIHDAEEFDKQPAVRRKISKLLKKFGSGKAIYVDYGDYGDYGDYDLINDYRPDQYKLYNRPYVEYGYNEHGGSDMMLLLDGLILLCLYCAVFIIMFIAGICCSHYIFRKRKKSQYIISSFEDGSSVQNDEFV